MLDLMRRVKKNFMKYWTAAGLYYEPSKGTKGETSVYPSMISFFFEKDRYQAFINQLFQFTTYFGILVANLINYFTDEIHPHGWRISLDLTAIPALLMLVGGIFNAKTPNSLVEQGRFDEARKVLEKVRGTKNVDAEYQDLVEASEEAHAVTSPFRTLLKRKYRPQLVIGALGILAFQQLTGNNSILFYAPVIFQSIGSWDPLGWLVPREVFPLEIKISSTKYSGVCQHDLHCTCGTVVSHVTLPPQIWDLLAVCWLNCLHEYVYLLPLAENKASSN
ncbi:hypothetical protein AHAS_Ahas04G0186800 [Arachis hypogaea]